MCAESIYYVTFEPGNVNQETINLGINNFGSSINNITDNNIFLNRNGGIYLYSASNNSLINNYVSKNFIGINLDSSSDNMVQGNDVYLNNYRGITTRYCSNINLTGNDVNSNGNNGVFLELSSDSM